MPWCGYWGAAGSAFWWVLPLIGVIVMAVMWFACARGFGGCMGVRGRTPGDVSQLRREIESLKEDVRKLRRQPQ